MKRSPMPVRLTPLRRTAPLQAQSAGLDRRVPLLRVNVKSAATRRTARDTGPSRKTRLLVLERDGWACVCCGTSVVGQPYSLQHRKRRSQGGGNSAANLITVLGTGTTGHHERIDSRRDPHDEAKGYTCRSYQDPAQVPVMVFSSPEGSGVLAWLSSDGRYLYDGPEGAVA